MVFRPVVFIRKWIGGKILLVGAFLVYPTLFLWPGLQPGNRQIIATDLEDSWGLVNLWYAVDRFDIHTGRTMFFNYPHGEHFWNLEQISQATMAIFVFACKFFLSPYQTLHFWILVGWVGTSFAVYSLGRVLSAGFIGSLFAGIMVPVIPGYRMLSYQSVAYAHLYPLVMVIAGGALVCSGSLESANKSKGWKLLIVGVVLSAITDYYIIAIAASILVLVCLHLVLRRFRWKIQVTTYLAGSFVASAILPSFARVMFGFGAEPEFGFGPRLDKLVFERLNEGLSWKSYFWSDGLSWFRGLLAESSEVLDASIRPSSIRALPRIPYLGGLWMLLLIGAVMAAWSRRLQTKSKMKFPGSAWFVVVSVFTCVMIADRSLRPVLDPLGLHPGTLFLNVVPRFRFPDRAGLFAVILLLPLFGYALRALLQRASQRRFGRLVAWLCVSTVAVAVADLQPWFGAQVMHPQSKQFSAVAEYLSRDGADVVADFTGRVPGIQRINGLRNTSVVDGLLVNAAASSDAAVSYLNAIGATHVVSFQRSIYSSWGMPDFGLRTELKFEAPSFRHLASFPILANNRDVYWIVRVYKVAQAKTEPVCVTCPKYIFDTDGPVDQSNSPDALPVIRGERIDLRMRTAPHDSTRLHSVRITFVSLVDLPVRVTVSTASSESTRIVPSGSEVGIEVLMRSGESASIMTLSSSDAAPGQLAMTEVAVRPVGVVSEQIATLKRGRERVLSNG
jgi:hypothetical protein